LVDRFCDNQTREDHGKKRSCSGFQSGFRHGGFSRVMVERCASNNRHANAAGL
jgi:hypothetical protein